MMVEISSFFVTLENDIEIKIFNMLYFIMKEENYKIKLYIKEKI